jgi:hypothetical protein
MNPEEYFKLFTPYLKTIIKYYSKNCTKVIKITKILGII